MDVSWLDPDQADDRALDGAVAVLEATRRADFPHEPILTPQSYLARLRHGWDGDPPLAAVAHEAGRVVGVVEVDLPHRDNTHAAQVQITVDPRRRRQGLGRALADAATERVRADGRDVVLGGGFDGPATDGFARALGMAPASQEVKRRQDLTAVDPADLDRLEGELSGYAADYELVRLPRRIPDDLVTEVVTMVAAINDAPLDDLALDDEVFSAERLRAFEDAQAAALTRTYRLAARHRVSGVLAGHTLVSVPAEQPHHAEQDDTSVLADHRGHRLGLLLKIGMLRWLRDAEPQIRVLDTWNAASNEHMVAVNEALGYQVVATATVYQRRLS